MEDGRQFPTSRSFVGTATTLRVLPLMMGLLLLPLGCGILGPRTLLEPSELCSDHGNSAIATFEDPNLERAIRTRLGVGAQDDLTCGLVSGFRDIGLVDYGITSLVGIQNLTSLMHLELGNNSITDISALSELTSLTQLFLYNNSISDISPLSGLTRLRWLTLYDNSIIDISALGGLTRLDELTLRNNSISDISALSGLTSLPSLFLDNNSITDISPLSGLTGLLGLHLRSNLITDISALRGLTRLRSLGLSNNPDLADIQPLLDNPGLGPIETAFCCYPDAVDLSATNVSCTDVAALKAKGVDVTSDCP